MEWKQLFVDPPKEYGIYPIIHDGMEQYQNVIDYHQECGFAGTVANVSYRENYPNEQKAWDDFNTGCRKYFDRGMKVWIYDEKGYPSGTAGGAVLERHPEFEGLELMCFAYWKTLTGTAKYRADTPSGKLFKALLLPLEGGEAVDISETVNSYGTLHFTIPKGAYRLVVFVQRRLFDSTHAAHSYSEPRRYVDLFNPDATKAFLEVTHDKYAEILSDEFGKGVKAFFTDEPSLIGWNIPEASYPLLTWSERFPELFYQKYGYAIEKALIAVCLGNGPDVIKRRCDFWEFTADLVSENFFGIIRKWCHAHHIKSSGHMLCEEHLLEHISCYGSYYRCAKQLDYPGIDQLESEPAALMNRDQIPIARLAASFADVYDSGEAFTEASDHTSRHFNKQIPIEWVRASMNWHLAQGINNITSYYNFNYFSKQQIYDLNQYIARLGMILRQGKRDSKVAVLYPEYAMWAEFQPTERSHNQGQSVKAMQIQSTFAHTSWELLNRQIDFDYINENELCNGTIASGKLQVLTRQYECVVLPCAHVMSEKSIDCLCRFMNAGGKVIAVETLPEISRETGKKGEFLEQLLPYLKKDGGLLFALQRDFVKIAYALPRTIRLLPDSVECLMTGFEGALDVEREIVSPNILSHIRKDGDKMIVFLCNMGGNRYQGQFSVSGYQTVELADPLTGTVVPHSAIQQDDMLIVNLNLNAYQGMVYILQ